MQLPLPPGNFGAYLFDCDGTIVDSMPLHYVAWKTVLGSYGCEFPEETFYAWGGLPVRQIIAQLNEKFGLKMPIDEVLHRKEQMYFDSLPQLQPVPEVVAHIEARYGEIPFAVVSGSTRDSVDASLSKLGLLDKFDTFVCAGDYKKAKPDPEPFLIAAQRLGVPAEACIVFEDTDFGIQSAVAAGMAWVKVPPPWARR